MKWTIDSILEASGGTLITGDKDRRVEGISTDTRELKPGDAFVALRGERFDGHTFLSQAAQKGAAAVIVSEAARAAALPKSTAVVLVPDTLRALGHLARHVRNRFDIPVIGITGSNGKTSTKEMVASILEQNLSILKNPGNYNNLIGVPLTLMKLNSSHRMALIEMGINMPGEMARLVHVSRPTIGLITNIQPAHLQGLQSIDTILQEKGLLWRSLEREREAIVNLDDDRLREFAKSLRVSHTSYSRLDNSADVHLAGDIEYGSFGSRFRLVVAGRTLVVKLHVLGDHQVQNALAAAAVAHALGIDPEQIAAGLEKHRPVKQRMDVIQLADGTVVVDDTYNANPRSMAAAFAAIERVRGDHPFIVVLGEMRELGEETAELHRAVGRELAQYDVKRLVTLGELGREIINGAIKAGIPAWACHHVEDHDRAAEILERYWQPQAWILVKGSRGLTMEKVVERIAKKQ